MTGSGADIWGTSDSFRYAFQSLSGDFSIKARVVSLTPTDPWAKAGLMVRQSAGADSRHAMMATTPGSNGFAFQWRSETGAESSHLGGGATAFPNSWVRLVRTGGKITAFKATDASGTAFEQVGSPLPLNVTEPVLVGLCVTAHNNGALCTAEFREVAVTDLSGASLPAGWRTADVGGVGVPGGVARADGSWTVAGGGADIWGTSDSFRYVYTEKTGNFELRARIASIENTDPWAKAGFMVRASTAADSAHAMMVATPGANGFAFQWRSAAGGESSHTAGGATAYPYSWVRLVRLDGLLTAYKASDEAGANWEQVGAPVSVAASDPVLAGLCVTAHNNDKLCFAELRDVSIQDIPTASGAGLAGTYSNNVSHSDPVLARVDATVNFDWGDGSPDPSVSADRFSVRWEGEIVAQLSETYTFYTRADDGVRLWLNGELVIDQWHDQAAAEYTTSLPLVAGQKCGVRMEYYENGGLAVAQLLWSSPSTSKRPVPQSQLYPDPGIFVPPVVTGTSPEDGGLIDPVGAAISVSFSKPMNHASAEGAFSLANVGQASPPVTAVAGSFSWSENTMTFTPSAPLASLSSYTVTIGTGARDIAGNALAAEYTFSFQTGFGPGSGTGLVGQYFDEIALTAPRVTRTDPTINFSWGGGSPDPRIEPETYSARWIGFVQPRFTETYTFSVWIDNGVRLWIGNNLIVDDWLDIPPRELSGTVSLTAGEKYPIKLEMFENWGGASIKLYWSSAAQAKEIVPQQFLYVPDDTQPPTTPQNLRVTHVADRTIAIAWDPSTDDSLIARYDVYRDGALVGWTVEPFYRDTYLTPETTYTYAVQAVDCVGQASGLSQPVSATTLASPAPGTGTGLLGVYYDDMAFQIRKLVRVDPQVDNDWASGSPDATVEPDTFSIRWEGQIEPFYDEEYTFYTIGDDGIRVWVDGQVIINNWTDHAARQDKGTVTLKARQKHDIRVDYYENAGLAVAKLYWESLSQPKEIVPQSQLYPAEWLAGTQLRILSPLESATSPAWFEGKVGEDATSVTVSVSGGAYFDPVHESGTQWFVDTASANGLPYGIPLSASQPTAVAVRVQDVSTVTQITDYELKWLATVLNGMNEVSDEIVIRKGDSLLLAAHDENPVQGQGQGKGKGNGGVGQGDKNGVVKIDADGDGKVDCHGAPDEGLPFRYTNAGHFVATAWVRGHEVGTLTVTVVDVDLDGPIACEVGFKRSKDVDVFPADANGEVAFTAADEAYLGVSVKEPTPAGATLYLTAVQRGTPILQARVGGECGPLIRQQEIDEFNQRNTAAVLLMLKPEDAGGRVGRATLRMEPLVVYPDRPERNPYAVIRACSPGATFDGGETELVVSTAQFSANPDGSGSYSYNIHMTEGAEIFCVSVAFFQGGSLPQAMSFDSWANGDSIEFKVEETIFCAVQHSDPNVAIAKLLAKPGQQWHPPTDGRPFRTWLTPSGQAGQDVGRGDFKVAVSAPDFKYVKGSLSDGSPSTLTWPNDAGTLELDRLGLMTAGKYDLHVKYLGTENANPSQLDFADAVTVTPIGVTDIAFNWDEDKHDVEALNIRQDGSGGTEIHAAEYQDGRIPKPKPVLYIMNSCVKVKARLVAMPGFRSVTVKAKASSQDEVGSLTDIVEKVVEFDARGISIGENVDNPKTPTIDEREFVLFDLAGPTPAQVQKSVDKWEWIATKVNDTPVTPVTFDRTEGLPIYTIFHESGLPWNQLPKNVALPWVQVLDIVCEWAKGAVVRDEAAAIACVTPNAYNRLGFTYNGGAPTHLDGRNIMDLTRLLNDRSPECQDMSAVVVLFTRIVGGGPETGVLGIMANGVDKMETLPVSPVGPLPFQVSRWFTHQVASYRGGVYDACLRVQQNNPTVPVGWNQPAYLRALLKRPQDGAWCSGRHVGGIK